jgi:excisionase family DNA binding protein
VTAFAPVGDGEGVSEPLALTIPRELVEAIARRVVELLPPPEQGSVWLTVAEAAEHLATSEDALRAKLKPGRSSIPHHRVEGRILFDRNELDRWVHGERQP